MGVGGWKVLGLKASESHPLTLTGFTCEIMPPKYADNRYANSEDPGQTAPVGAV